MIFIQESKSEEELSSIQKNSIWDDTHGWIEAPAEGNSGGLFIFWDTRKFEMNSASVSKHWIHIRGR